MKSNSHIGIWILILCKSRIVILHRLVTYYGVCYYLRREEVRHLPRWGVGALRVTLGKHGGGLAVFRELPERSASSTEPCREWGSPFASPNPGDWPRQVTGERWVTQCGRHGDVPHSTGRLPWDSCRSVWRAARRRQTGFQARSKDQEILEEGGGAGPLTFAQKRSWGREVELGLSKFGHLLLWVVQVVRQQRCNGHCLSDSVQHSSWKSNCAVHKSLGNGEGTPP